MTNSRELVERFDAGIATSEGPTEGADGSRGQARLTALVVEDDAASREALMRIIGRDGFEVTSAGSLAEADARCRAQADRFDCAVVDVRLPDGSGTELLGWDHASPAERTILVTGYPSFETSLEALRGSAMDYLPKPIDTSRLRRLLGFVRACRAHQDRMVSPATAAAAGDATRQVVEASESSRRWSEQLVAASLSPRVVVRGPAGAGKMFSAQRLLQRWGIDPTEARLLHPGRDGDAVLDLARLLGGTAGAATAGAAADAAGGATTPDRAWILRLSARATTTTFQQILALIDAAEACADAPRWVTLAEAGASGGGRLGQLRTQVLQRLGEATVDVPALADRRGDLPRLVQLQLRELKRVMGGVTKAVHRDAFAAMLQYAWPGNVRQLWNVLGQAYAFPGPQIQLRHLPEEIAAPARLELGDAHSAADPQDLIRRLVGRPLGEIEDAFIRATLEACNGDKTMAARQLGISRRTIYNRL